jgi:hypothetical protein
MKYYNKKNLTKEITPDEAYKLRDDEKTILYTCYMCGKDTPNINIQNNNYNKGLCNECLPD